jgi:hypothetical protein
VADFFKILKADPLGEPWQPRAAGAKPVQNWWCQVEGQEWAVSIGKQVGNTLRPGQHVYGDLKYAKSQKGTEYWKFDSQQVPDDVQRPTDDPSTPAQATAQAATGAVVGDQIPAWAIPLYNMVEYIYNEMKKMDADAPPPKDAQTQLDTEPTPEPAAGVEQLSGDPIDPETKQTLDEIFTPPETPEDVPKKKGK